MKKLLTTIVSVLLAAVMVMFVGCGDKSGETGIIKGNYQEATAEEVATKLNSVSTDTMFGDKTAEDWAAGLSIFFGLDMSLNGEDMSLECGMDMDLATAEAKGTFKGKMPPSEEGLSEIDISIYNDAEFVYADLSSILPEGTPAAAGKMKVSNEEIMMMSMSLVGGMQNPGEPLSVEEGGDETVGGEETMSLAAIVMMLDEMGVKFAMDTANDELKVKMSFTKEFMMGMMGAPVAEEGADALVDPFKEFVFDLYLHIDAQGQFAQ